MTVDEIKQNMANLVNEIKSHHDLLNSISDVLTNSLGRATEDAVSNKSKVDILMEELTILEQNIKNQEDIKRSAEANIDELEPKITEQSQLIQNLKSTIYDLDQSKTGLLTESKEHETKLGAHIAELNEKSANKQNLLNSIDTKVDANMNSLREVKASYDGVGEKYAALEYIFNNMDMPEVEIMGIIASNRPVSLDIIKSQSKTVAAVMVGRAIAKLEADGKIMQNDEEKWDLSTTILNQL